MPRRRTDIIDILIGRNIRSARRAAGKSQQALGETLHVSCQQVQKYERGISPVYAAQLCEIAQILNVPVASLLPKT